jgi:hypothetical protein
MSDLMIEAVDGRWFVVCGHHGCPWRCPLTMTGRNRQAWNGRRIGAALHHLTNQHSAQKGNASRAQHTVHAMIRDGWASDGE